MKEFELPESLEPTGDYEGLFVPSIIRCNKDLNLFEVLLLSWIRKLTRKNGKGCTLTNQELGEKMGVKSNTISKYLSHLRKLKLIVDVSLDRGTRVIIDNI